MSDTTTHPATTAAPKTGGRTIIDAALADGRFTTLATALTAAGLVETLKGPGPFTVFAPTDEAFKALPAGTLDGLLKDTATLTSILTYHVVPGRLNAIDLKALGDKNGDASAKTVEGQMLPMHFDKGTVHLGEGNKVSVTTADVGASNGVIHVIDGILMPAK